MFFQVPYGRPKLLPVIFLCISCHEEKARSGSTVERCQGKESRKWHRQSGSGQPQFSSPPVELCAWQAYLQVGLVQRTVKGTASCQVQGAATGSYRLAWPGWGSHPLPGNMGWKFNSNLVNICIANFTYLPSCPLDSPLRLLKRRSLLNHCISSHRSAPSHLGFSHLEYHCMAVPNVTTMCENQACKSSAHGHWAWTQKSQRGPPSCNRKPPRQSVEFLLFTNFPFVKWKVFIRWSVISSFEVASIQEI